ncbi:alpha-L-rhamnosidase C-terminal domain-containing protein [Armatimonas sp.]|uniref:alpha-L-rhamnosidase C-terminal domain-containing protein n=1 Tax=Armatimonas sp. TaxID=1872638 RepID=UPI00286A375B|nr:alpha-L-rhamnosidase C-terminal domain-containing protein [Armatimonas sp.]
MKTPDPRGPIVRKAVQPKVTSDGVEAKGYKADNTAPRGRPPAGKWVWLAGESHATLFRKEVTVTRVPKQALAYLSADNAYRLWINGVLVARGPADIGMDYHRVPTGKYFYDTLDLAPYLKPGVNTIAAEVFFTKLIGWEGSRGQGGFFLDAPGITATDATWYAAPCKHWVKKGNWHYEAAAEPDGWRESGFDVSAWSAATPVPDLWQPFVPSQIPARMEVVYPSLPAVLPRWTGAGGEAFRIRWDRVLSAYLSFVVKGGKGATLTIEPNEPNALGHHRMATAMLTGGVQTFELPFMDSFSVVNLSAKNITEPLEILDIRASFVSQPVAYRGSFSCSDPDLTRLWSVCRWATQICLQTHHLDSPHHQEPISDPGDYLIASLVNYAAFFQPALTVQDSRKYAWILEQCKNQNFHTSYALLWLQMVLDYWDHTGDDSLVRELAPQIHALLDTFTSYIGKNGLISEAPNYMFMDWVDILGFPGHHPPAVIGQGYMTAFFYRALADGVRVAELTKDSGRTLNYQRTRTELATAFERELWVLEKGLYRDGKPFQTHVKPGQWLPADKEIETLTAHLQFLAALYDLAPKERQAAIVERAITAANFSCQPYFMHFVFAALAHTGLFEKYAPEQLKRWKIIEETQSLREMWDRGDLSHSWGGTPLYQLTTQVLGVQPKTPGFATFTVTPMPMGLSWAKGVVPTPHGDIRVEWRKQGEKLALVLTVPKGCRAEVTLPGSEKAMFFEAGVGKLVV